MLQVVSPSQQIADYSLLQGLSAEAYQVLIMHLNQMLTDLDTGLESQQELLYFSTLLKRFICGLAQISADSVEENMYDEHNLIYSFPGNCSLYLNFQRPDDRLRMVNSRSLAKPAFFETVRNFLGHFHFPEEFTHPMPRYFLITNLYEWYAFEERALAETLEEAPEEMTQYFKGWYTQKPGFRSQETLDRFISQAMETLSLRCVYFSFYGLRESLNQSFHSNQSRLIPIGLFLKSLTPIQVSRPQHLDTLTQEISYLLGIEYVSKGDLGYYKDTHSKLLPKGYPDGRHVLAMHLNRLILSEILESAEILTLEKQKVLEKESRSIPFSKASVAPFSHSLLIPILPEGTVSPQTYLNKLVEEVPITKHSTLAVRTQELPRLNPSIWGEMMGKLMRRSPQQPYVSPQQLSNPVRKQLQQVILKKIARKFGQKFSDWAPAKDYVRLLPKAELKKHLLEIKICDPCCGHGNFLLSALHELLVLFQELQCLSPSPSKPLDELQFLHIAEGLYPVNHQGDFIGYPTNISGDFAGEQERTLHEAIFQNKLAIIQNCLYGIATSPQEAAIVRHKLLLSLLSNHYQFVGKQTFKWMGLKGFDPNIHVGNPILSTRPVHADLSPDGQEFLPSDPRQARLKALKGQLAKLQPSLSLWDAQETPVDTNRQQSLQEEITTLEQQLKAPWDFWRAHTAWQDFFPFLWDENGKYTGFDLVCSAPLSIRQEKFKSFNGYLRERFKGYDSQSNYYLYCLELSIRLLQPGGQLLVLVPDKWTKAQYSKKLRAWTREHADWDVTPFRSPSPAPAQQFRYNLLVTGNRRELTNSLKTPS